MNVLVKQSLLYHLHHAAYSTIKNQYHIQTVAAERTNDIIIVTTLLRKQVNKTGKASTPAA